VKWALPGPDAPGHPRRRRDLARLLDAELNPANIDALHNYLVQFIVEPTDRAEALEELLDLSQVEVSAVVLQLLGQGEVANG